LSIGVSASGLVKRAKYQGVDEGVEGVGLARRGPPQDGQATCFQVGWRSSGLPGLSKSTSSGRHHRQLVGRHRHDAAISQWMTGIGQPQ
jgi:hypothetical protein